jgi:acyl-coenzyme A synthetase/AMP-(fatty) acid ligase/acyl-CoA thioesterase FadM
MLACQRLGVMYSATAVDSVEEVLTSRAHDLRPKLVIAPDAPVTHGGVVIDCAAKLSRAVPGVPLLLAAPWHHPSVQKTLVKFAALSDEHAFVAAAQLAPPLPCASDHPLFVAYTSGSTGKPKGVVHGHGGYVAGVLASMAVVFNAAPGEGGGGSMLTVGSAGWITGQSYMLMGPLLAAVRSVVMVGSPVYPTPMRMIHAVASERCSLLKTGSAVVRQLMTDPANAARLDAVDTSSLRCATFCAEPVSVEVHEFAHAHITDRFINSYWATEHGAMVFSRDVASCPAAHTVGGVAIRPDSVTWPLPWVRAALHPVSSDVIITGPYPSLALTVFGNPDEVNDPGWRGDLDTYKASYWPANGGGFVQGDVARAVGEEAGAEAGGDNATDAMAEDAGAGVAAGCGGFTFHGRSDEVINVNGNRVATEQIERCLWGLEVGAAANPGGASVAAGGAPGASKRVKPNVGGGAAAAAAVAAAPAGGGGTVGVGGGGYIVKDCCVVGAPDFVKGTAPVAFVVFERKRGAGRVRVGGEGVDTGVFQHHEEQVVTAAAGGGSGGGSSGSGVAGGRTELEPDPGPDLGAFKAAAAAAVAAGVGAYAAPDHVFAVAVLPKTITNKTARKTLQLLLAGHDAPTASLARKEVLPPIAAAVLEWRLTGATLASSIHLSPYWRKFTFQDHSVQGRPIVPGAGWLCVLAHELRAQRLSDVAFMRGVYDADAEVRVVKRRRLVQATVGSEVTLRANTQAGAATPAAVGPSIFGMSEVPRGRPGAGGARGSAGTRVTPGGVKGPGTAAGAIEGAGAARGSGDEPAAAEAMDTDTEAAAAAAATASTATVAAAAAEPMVTDDATGAQHYRRCSALRLDYQGAYRAVEGVEWCGHVFRARVTGTHLAAVLDAGLQVVCAAVRANTYIPVAVGEFQISEGLDVFEPGARCVVHGEIVEQYPEFLIADLRYEREVDAGADADANPAAGAGADVKYGAGGEGDTPGSTPLKSGVGGMFRSLTRKRKSGGNGGGGVASGSPGPRGSPVVLGQGGGGPSWADGRESENGVGGAEAGTAVEGIGPEGGGIDRAETEGVRVGNGKTYKVFAAMGRVRFARVEGTKPRLQPEGGRGKSRGNDGSQALDPKTALARLRQLTTDQRVEAVRSVVRGVVSDLTDAEVDFDKTVFDNGMHSLNAVELLARVNEALGTGVTTKLVVADAPMADFAAAVAEHAMTYVAPSESGAVVPYPNVDYDNLNEIVRRRLAGKSIGSTPYIFLAKYFAYNWFKKAFQFFRIGGHRFVLHPPRVIALDVEVMMRRRVEFRDIDMNQHYTVEMIVARSVDGVEQLMAMSGLSHIELYYKRNIFAAKIQSTFHKELAYNDPYIIRTKITKVTGPLMDIRVAFLDVHEVLCFEILWTILIVLDSTERILLDWENVDLMEGKRLAAGPGKGRIEAPATPIGTSVAKTKGGE